VVVVVIVVVAAGSSSPNSAAANASTATGAATVQRRDLVETDTESGTLSYDAPQTVYNRLSGTITWLPNVGQVIHAGGTLFKVDGAPVILMNGTTPAYRDLSAADSAGEDILQLNRNLVDLGFNPDGIVINDTWQAATTDGVELFQGSLGEPETGILTLGQIVFLPGDQLISTVDGTVGSTGGGGSANSNASITVDPPAPQFVSLRVSSSTTTPTTPTTSTTTQPSTTTQTTSTTTTTTPTTTSGHKKKKQHPSQSQTIAALIQLLRAENAQLQAELRAHHSSGGTSGSGGGHKSSGGHKGSSGSHSGGDSGSGSGSGDSGSGGTGGGTPVEILQTTSTRLVVTVDLSASSQSEAVVGEHVTVELPDGNTVNGRISAVSPVAQNSNSGSGSGNGNGGGGGGGSGNGNGGSSSSTVPVTIAINGHHLGAGLDQAAVSVNFVEQRANHVLSVPVTALLATSGSSYAVQEASPPYKLIPVTTGLFAAGYVQISGAGIYSGLQVTDSQG
jgi:cell division septation protein DedD